MGDKERIKQLEQQIEALREQQSRYAMRIGNEIERRTKLLRQQLDREYSRTYKEAMEQSMKRLQSQCSDEAEKELSRLRLEIDKLEQEAERTKAALRETEKNRSRAEQTGRAEAVSALEQLDDGIKEAQSMPCEEFYPKKLSIYKNAREEGDRLFKKGMLSQAFSVLSSALLGVKRLTVDCDNRSRLLMHYAEQFRVTLYEIKTQLSSAAAHTAEYNGEMVTVTDTELAFWSDGLTEQLYAELEEYDGILRAIDQKGVKGIKKMTDDDPVDFIRKKTDSLVLFWSRVQITLEYAFSACRDYWRFEDVYLQAVIALSSQGFSVKGCRYGRAQPDIKMPASFLELTSCEQCIENGGIPDLRETREVLFSRELLSGEKEAVVLSFLPVRNDTLVHSEVTMRLSTRQARRPLYDELEAVLASVGVRTEPADEAPIRIRNILRMTEVNSIAAERLPTRVSARAV